MDRCVRYDPQYLYNGLVTQHNVFLFSFSYGACTWNTSIANGSRVNWKNIRPCLWIYEFEHQAARVGLNLYTRIVTSPSNLTASNLHNAHQFVCISAPHPLLLPASIYTALSVSIFKKRTDEVWTEVFFRLPWWLSNYPKTPSTCIPPIKNHHLYMLLNSLFCLPGFSRPFVAYFLPR